jgi:phage gp29-like protein
MCDLLLLGQTLTSETGPTGGGSLALGQVHERVRGDVIDAAAGWLAEVRNEQLLPAIARVNGVAMDFSEMPWWEASRDQVRDTQAAATMVATLRNAGVPMVRSYVYELLEMPEPGPGDEVFEPLAPAGYPPVGGPGGFGGGGVAEVRRAIGEYVARMPRDAREYFLARLDQ